MIYQDIWGSIVKLSQDLIASVEPDYPDIDIQFIDWEAHANIEELPAADLIGPTSLTVTEHESGLFEASFAIGASSYSTDQNLFRHRDYIARIFELMRPEMKMKLYDAGSASEKGVMVFTNGTLIAPMSRAETRPWQYCQGVALLIPQLD